MRGRAATAVRPAPRRSRAALRRRLVVLALIGPVLLGLLIFFVYPLIASVYYSFTSFNLVSPPVWIGLRNYTYLFTQDPLIGTAVLNTLWFVVFLVPIRIITALCIAGLLARARTASGFWRTLFYLPSLVPPVASVVAFVFLFNPGTGPVNQVLKAFGITGPLWFNDPAWSKPSLVILGIWVMGDIMIIFLASLLDVPTEQYEAASLDGANGLQKVRYVTLPSMGPVLLFAVITGIIAALQYFTEAAVASTVASGKATVGGGSGDVIGYPDDSLLTYTQWLYVRGFSNYQLGYASAMAVVLFVVAALFLVLLLRRVKAFTPEGAR
ncbi:MAG: sugar ABC transporter permease [Microbacterium sp.]|nr:sugar ABC transporter permease [Microbacterium sp.]MBN9175197.1 sugar ABC transporter permease [Microbacterium sp.]MBN9184720.1 sugar ABC transporter permease [Microbacterium sp.]MBN9187283.1 sugar ABC transporter permease [Microbacterium sp.]MBN9193682.1 sugar ABC transporter permease [Microbacterium sp.]